MQATRSRHGRHGPALDGVLPAESGWKTTNYEPELSRSLHSNDEGTPLVWVCSGSEGASPAPPSSKHGGVLGGFCFCRQPISEKLCLFVETAMKKKILKLQSVCDSEESRH